MKSWTQSQDVEQRSFLRTIIQKGNIDLFLSELQSAGIDTWVTEQNAKDGAQIKAQFLHDPHTTMQRLKSRYYRCLEYIADQILHRQDLVQEAISDTWYKMYCWLERVTYEEFEGRNILPYLCGVIRNASIDILRKEKKQMHKIENKRKEIEEIERLGGESPEDIIIRIEQRKELKNLVQDTLSQLPQKYEYALRLYYFSEEHYWQLARATGKNAATLRSQVSRGKILMKKLLERRGVLLE